jgi:hypothetical protein
MFKKSINS